MKKLRVAVIGCGGISQIAHFPTYKKLDELAEIVAAADINLEHAQECKEKYQIPRIYSSAEEMLSKERPDAVSICTWNISHADFAIRALNAGCHVLCEKPPAITVKDAERICAAARASGKILMYGFHYRYAPEVELLRKYIEADELGDVYAARALFLRRRGIPGWGVFTNKELQGGGALIDIGVHALDTILYLLGYPSPSYVLGTSYQEIGCREGVGLLGEWDWKNFNVDDMARGMITFENGKSIILEAAFACNIKEKEILKLSLMGDRGGADLFPVTLLNQDDTPLRIYGEKHGTLVDITPVHYVDTSVSYHEREVTEFVHCCLENRQPYSTPEQGVILQKIICGLYQSAAERRPVDLRGI